MTVHAVELRAVSKVYSTRQADVLAVKDVDICIKPGEFFTLLGPSGCGKSTTLRMIAGFEEPTEGDIRIQGRSMAGVPASKRPSNMVFQNYALFPHLSVGRNVGFGLAVKRVPRAERERRVKEALELVQLPGIEDRKPSQLSGGQQQRVALARALVNRPTVLLLDEPLGALDLKLRQAMQIELKHLQNRVGITFIYVTHDQEEALTMSDRIAVMNEGRVLQIGRPVEIYEKPRTRFVADFIGETNFLTGTVTAVNDTLAHVDLGRRVVQAAVGHNALRPGQEITLAIRPEKLLLSPENEPGLPGTVRQMVYIGTDSRYIVDLHDGGTVVSRVQNSGRDALTVFAPGDRVHVIWQPEHAQTLTQ